MKTKPQLLTCLGGGQVKQLSKTTSVANFTSSKSIVFLRAWLANTLASSSIHVTYPLKRKEVIKYMYFYRH